MSQRSDHPIAFRSNTKILLSAAAAVVVFTVAFAAPAAIASPAVPAAAAPSEPTDSASPASLDDPASSAATMSSGVTVSSDSAKPSNAADDPIGAGPDSEFSVSVSGDIKKDLLEGEFNLVKPFGRTADKLESIHSQRGIPDSVLLMEPTEADNPIQESMISKMQTISRFRKGSQKEQITERRSYVDKVRANRVYFDQGLKTLGRKKKYIIYDERTARPIGTVEIISGNANTSSANLIEGSLNSVYEGCYIRY